MLTKKQKQHAANTVITGLKNLEDLWSRLLRQEIKAETHRKRPHIFQDCPRGHIDRTGTVNVKHTISPIREKSLSQHEKMTLTIFMRDFDAAFKPVGENLHALLPGQYLCWTFNNEDPARHKLYLGFENMAQHQSAQHMIATPLSRWKLPLLRLSAFFEDQTLSITSAEHTWHFVTSVKPSSPNLTMLSPSTEKVTARSLDEAMRIASFYDAPSLATPAPGPRPTDLAFELGKKTQVSSIVRSAEKAIPEKENANSENLTAFYSEISPHVKTFNEILKTLDSELLLKFTCDLVAGNTRMRVENHHLASDEEIASAEEKKHRLHETAESMTAILGTYLRLIYPGVQNAEMILETRDTVYQERSKSACTIRMDGMVEHMPSIEPEKIMNHAMYLDWAVRGCKTRRFIIFDDIQARLSDNVKFHGPVILKGTTPEHAWTTCRHMPRAVTRAGGRNALIQEIYPIPRQRWHEAEIAMKDRINHVFKNLQERTESCR